MSWALEELIPFDIESTGLNVEADRVVTATVARVAPGRQTEVRSHLIAVDVDIPAEASAVHGISTEYARENGKPAAETLDLIAGDLVMWHRPGPPIVGMNLVYDLTLLDRELRRHGLPTLDERLGRQVGPVIDVCVIDRALDKFRPGKRKLTDLCAHYGVRLDNAHEATSDALGACRVAYKLAHRGSMPAEELLKLYGDRRYPRKLVRGFQAFGRMSLAELHAAQVDWCREQTEDRGLYWSQVAADARARAEKVEQRLAELDVPDPAAIDELAAERDAALEEAAEYERRVADLDPSWPLRSAPAAVAS